MDITVNSPLDTTAVVQQGLMATVTVPFPSSEVVVNQSVMVAANVQQPSINMLVVSGPQGPQGPIFNLTGQYPIFYDAGSGIVGIVSGYYVTFPDLTAASGALVAQISAAAAGVNSINGLSGFVSIAAVKPLYTSISGQTIYISGSGLATSGDINGLSGYVNSLVAATGQAAWTAAQNNAINLSGNLGATGSYLYTLITGSTGVVNLNGYITTGQADLRYYPLSTNPSGYLTTGQSGQFYPASNPQGYSTSGDLTSASGVLVNLINTASGGVVSVNGASGILTIRGTGNVVVSTSGQVITISGDTGAYASFATVTALQSTGQALYAIITGQSGQAIIDYATKTQLTATGATLFQRDLDISGALQAQINTVNANPSGYITTGQTGQFYAASNPQQYARSGDVAATGVAAMAYANSIGSNVSGALSTSGTYLQGQINNLLVGTPSQTWQWQTGSSGNLIKNTPSGFILRNYLDTQTADLTVYNLTVEGTQTINNTNNLAVGNQYIYLNTSGIAQDGGIQFLRSGMTAGSLKWNESIQKWQAGFSGTESTIILASDTGQFADRVQLTNTGVIIEGQIVTLSGVVLAASGGLEARIAQTGSAVISYSNGIGLNLSGNLTATGQRLSAVTVTGSNTLNNVNLFGTGGIAVFVDGSTVYISGVNVRETGISAQFFVTGVQSGVSNMYVSYPTGFATAPVVVTQLQSVYSSIYGSTIQNVTRTGFNFILSSPASGNNDTFINVLAVERNSTWINVSGKQLFTSGVPSGASSLYVNYPIPFFSVPVIVTNTQCVNETIYLTALQNITATGFNVLFAAPVTGSGELSLNIYAVESGNYFGTTNAFGGVNGGVNLGVGSGLFADSFLGNLRFNSIQGIGGVSVIGVGNTYYLSGLNDASGNLIVNKGIYQPRKVVSSDYSVLPTDCYLYCSNANPITLTCPSPQTVSGMSLRIKLTNTGQVYLTGASTDRFDGSPLYAIVGQYSTRELHAFGQDGSVNQWYIW